MVETEAALLAQLSRGEGRRVYADWLEESGRSAEAEFLRLQSQSVELEVRMRDLSSSLDRAWLERVGDVRGSRELQVRGREVRIVELKQFSFYAGLLEGLPTAERNAEAIDNLVQSESRPGAPAWLLRPTETPIDLGRPYPFGTPARVPSIACVAALHSFKPARALDSSSLTVIWFQENYAFPIAPAVLQQLRELDWDTHAVDVEL